MRTKTIANRAIICIDPTGERHTVVLRVGLPEQIDAQEAHCAITLEGLEPERPIIGVDTLQALTLALSFLKSRLHDIVGRGWSVLTSDGEKVDDIEAFIAKGLE